MRQKDFISHRNTVVVPYEEEKYAHNPKFANGMNVENEYSLVWCLLTV